MSVLLMLSFEIRMYYFRCINVLRRISGVYEYRCVLGTAGKVKKLNKYLMGINVNLFQHKAVDMFIVR